jgi:hypothetical protein
MKVVLSQINSIGVLRRMSVTYTATLSVHEATVLYVSSLLHAERLHRDTRALSCFKQATLVIRWFLDGTRVAQLAVDNAIGRSTAYDYLHEGIWVLAAQAPSLEAALLAAKMAGYNHVNIDGTLIETDRCRTRAHPRRGSVVVGQARQPRRERPGRHRSGRLATVDLQGTPRPRARHHRPAGTTEMLPLLAAWTEDQQRVLGDLGYEGEADTITVAFKKPKGGELTDVQKTYNKVHNGIQAIGERGNSLLKTTFKALRNVSLCPWKIGKIARVALVLLPFENGRTT